MASIDELESGISKEIVGGVNQSFPFEDAYVMLESGLFKIKEIFDYRQRRETSQYIQSYSR